MHMHADGEGEIGQDSADNAERGVMSYSSTDNPHAPSLGCNACTSTEALSGRTAEDRKKGGRPADHMKTN